MFLTIFRDEGKEQYSLFKVLRLSLKFCLNSQAESFIYTKQSYPNSLGTSAFERNILYCASTVKDKFAFTKQFKVYLCIENF